MVDLNGKDFKSEFKTRETAGADEKSPSKSQYFSWINSTNEGSTEAQTLTNLEYFRWLRDEYGMQLDIYAWDAGNLDGARGTYENFDSPKIKAQYPNGYEKIGKAAKAIDTKLGVWCGPDGFGDTPEEERARHELMVSLCRDHNFGLFKMDSVCSRLREEKQDAFVEMMKECRKYSPELILLNHRLRLGKGLPYATTFLWNGTETYTDIHIGNKCCAPHHRAYMFHRGNVDGLQRLAEDHGVCISSCSEYFDDELIYQGFGRCLILAPEIYGNPWFLRDHEQTKLARIYNLHRTYRDILVDGMLLPKEYGPSAVSRGNGKTRFITTGNDSWETVTVKLNLNTEIGLERCDGDITVSIHHPYEKYIGTYRYGDVAEVEIAPFRACLIEVSVAECAYPMLTGCSYEVIHEKNGVPTEIKIIASDGKIEKLVNGERSAVDFAIAPFDNTVAVPVKLTDSFERAELPANAEQICETALFTIDNDAFEARERRRAGETAIPEVKAARDAFFDQVRYKMRGCESAFAFDGDEETFFGASLTPHGSEIAFKGGCLRVDFGAEYDADNVVIEYFDIESDDYPYEFIRMTPSYRAQYSTDLDKWEESYLGEIVRVRREVREMNRCSVHNIESIEGSRKRVIYPVNGKIRYFRAPGTHSYMFKIALVKDGHEIELDGAKASNLLPSYRDRSAVGYRSAEVEIPTDARKSAFVAVALDGIHGDEGAYVVGELDGKLYGCPDRAASYPVNPWECAAREEDHHFTYYLPVTEEMRGRKLKLHVMEMDALCENVPVTAYLCESNDEREGTVLEF